MRRLIVCLIILLFGGGFAFTKGGTVAPPSFVGPCDVIAGGCAEAYSVDGAMTTAYNGPILQLALASNHSTTLDLGQTANRQTDMTTWSAFCGGVAGNCLVSKIYAQIHTTSNDLVPSTVDAPLGPSCVVGTYGTLACAAVFAIEPATGLPRIVVGLGPNSIHAPGGAEYSIGGTDVAATGITGGAVPQSIMQNGTLTNDVASCCANFGRFHKYDAAATQGTDFAPLMFYGRWTGAGGPYGCTLSTDSCTAVELEGAGVTGLLLTMVNPAPNDMIVTVTADTTTSPVTIAADTNGIYLSGPYVSSGPPFAPGNFIHLGGGGDLSQPATPTKFREGLVTNTTLSPTDITALLANERSKFPAVNFRNPP